MILNREITHRPKVVARMADEPRREVLGFDGKVIVVGPTDKMLVVLPQGTTVETAQKVIREMREIFGEGRTVVMAGDVKIGIQQSSEIDNVSLAREHGIEEGQFRGRVVAGGSIWHLARVIRVDQQGVHLSTSQFTRMVGQSDRMDTSGLMIFSVEGAARSYPVLAGYVVGGVDPAWSEIISIHRDHGL